MSNTKTEPTGRGAILSARDWRAIQVILPFLLRYRWQVLLATICLIMITICTLAVPLFMKEIVDGLNDPTSLAVAVPLVLLISYGAVRFASVVFRELRSAIFGRVSVRAMRRLSLRVLTHLHSLDLEYHLARRTGAISRDLDRGVDAVDRLLRLLVFNIAPTLLQFAGISAVLLYSYSWYFGAITAASVVIYGIYTVYITNWRTPFIRASNDANSRANDRAVDSLINYETVKQFGNEAREAAHYDDDLRIWEQARRRNRNSLAALNTGQSFFTTVGITGTMVLAAYEVARGTMTIGDLVLINSYGAQIFGQINNLGGTYRELKRGLTDIERMFDILDTEPTIHDAPGADALPAGTGTVVFRDLNFAYHEDRPILQNVSFTVPAGSKVAIVGPSGAGKSTLARLLFRFYDPDAGQIMIDSTDIRSVQLDSLREAIGIVPQDTTLFNSTLYDNIAYGDPDASDEDVIAAARLAHLHDLIDALPEGLDTLVGERGLKLSGGEKQRVAIARAILKRPRILLFDEATSSLDSASEQAILLAMSEVAAGHTTIAIAHRLSTIADADKIVVLNKGTVAETGDHATLYARNGTYRELWDLQQAENQKQLRVVTHAGD